MVIFSSMKVLVWCGIILYGAGERALVELLRHMIHAQEVLGLIPTRVEFFSVCSMFVVGLPHKQLGAKAYYNVMINAPLLCRTLNRLQEV